MTHLAQPPGRSVASRITAILLTFRAGHTHSLTELAQLTGLPMSTVHRLTAELASWQLLTRLPDGRYAVGSNLRQLAGDAQQAPHLGELAALVVSDLSAVTHRRARLGVLEAGRVAYVEKRWGADPPIGFRAGVTVPAHATALGKALLAFTPRPAFAPVPQQLTAYTSRTITSRELLQQQLQTVRLTRVAQSWGELVAGDCAVAVPVFGPGGAVAAALELQVHEGRGDLEMCRAMVAVAARSLSRELSLQVSGGEASHPRLMSVPRDDARAASRS